MGSYSNKKHKKSKHSKKNKHHMRRKTRKMGGGGMGVAVQSGSSNMYINPASTSQIAGCRSDNTTATGAYYLNTPLAVGGQSGGGKLRKNSNKKKSRKMGGGSRMSGMGVVVNSASPNMYINPATDLNRPGLYSDNTTAGGAYYLNTPLAVGGQSGGSKLRKNGNKKKSRKMGGGMGGGMGVVVESASPNMYINPATDLNRPGLYSDNTTAGGAYYLNTPLAVGGQKGGGQVCTQPPYQFLQRGGGKRLRKNMRHKKGSRHMKGGNGNFWNFAKFWNPDNPGQGGNVLSLSPRGISPSGIGSPVSTAGNPPIPPIQPWPAEKLIFPHDYTKGGFQSGGGKRTRKGKGRGLKGGGIIDDLQTFGRDIVYRLGSAVNGLSGFDNKVYNVNPSPTFQFPRGLGNITSGASSYNSLNLKNIYDKSYSEASLK